jgi:short subunit dehydrogenase-like uncharacterized protein
MHAAGLCRIVMNRAASHPFLLYGANGYTGELIAREAVRRGMRPILAGRSKKKIQALATELKCPSAVFELDNHTALAASIQDVRAVLNCAGPFSATARTVMQACLASHVHYLDITGEIPVFELARSIHDKARRSGIVLCPGVGFDVVPTDCVAVALKSLLPDATHLALGFESRSGFSRGTLRTLLEMSGLGSQLRRDGQIVSVPWGSQTRQVDFGAGERLAVGMAWGDVSTAYYSTGIGNIEVFISSDTKQLKQLRRANLLRPWLRMSWVQKLLKIGVARIVPPGQQERDNNPSLVWGEARNSAGAWVSARLRTANGYNFTVASALAILEEVMSNSYEPGFTTPATMMGADFVTHLPGSSEIVVQRSQSAA